MSDVTMNLRPNEQLFTEEPGVLFTADTDEVAAFSMLTEFKGLVTAHTREGKKIFRLDKRKGEGFVSRGKLYEIRPFGDEDGHWLSRYQIDLPEDALAGLTKQGNAEDMATPETLTGYIDGGFLVGLVYENNDGTWLRDDEQWVSIESDASAGLIGEDGSTTSFEVDPEQAADLIELFDSQHVTEAEAQPFDIEGA
jgi:hypothetical protein